VIGESAAILAAIVLALGMKRLMDAAWDRYDRAATVVEHAAGDVPAPAPTVRVNCAIHGALRAPVADVVVDFGTQPRTAHIPCSPCAGSREVLVAPAIAAWLVHNGAQRMDDLLARAVTP
jgi:hypothetical protein